MALARLLNKPYRRNLLNKVRLFSNDAGSTKSDEILVDEFNDRGVLTLNRPKVLNAVSLNMIQKILRTLVKWQDTKSLVIIKGAGDKSFSAGGDLKALFKTSSDLIPLVFQTHYMTNQLIHTYKIPYVALIDGITMGAGAGVSVHGSYRIATERTVFAMPEVAVGLLPDVGGTYILPRVRNKLGVYMALTGFKLTGKDVLKAGIATHYCRISRLNELESALLSIKNPNELDRILQRICTSDDLSPLSFANHSEQINNCFNATTIEQILRNLENDGSEWAQKTIETLRKMPPISLKVILKAINLGAKQTLAQCLQTEYKVMLRLLEENDFREGVRSLLITKDNNPKWNPSTIEEVTEERVLSFFKPFHEEKELHVEKQLAAYS